MYEHIQHPDITYTEKYGKPDGQPVICPVCGDECDTFYKLDCEILGCNMCIKVVDAYEEDIEEDDSVFADMF